MKIVYSEKCLVYQTPGHPEAPERIKQIIDRIKNEPKYQFIKPRAATEKELSLVHSRSLIEQVKQNTFFDPDTPNIKNIFDYARLAAGGAIKAAQLAAGQGYAFSLMRPPGHHATRDRVGGFCYFNNLAIAASKLLSQGKRVAILDLDVHHGNGSQDIFLGKKGVIFCSLHQSPFYPGTGLNSAKNCHNFPLPAGTTISQYQPALTKAVKIIEDFFPHLLAVSLGFDTHQEDHLADFRLTTFDYQTISQIVRKLQLPSFFVLEGGYSSLMAESVLSFFKAV